MKTWQAALLLIVVGRSAFAQTADTIHIPDNPTCTSCRLDLRQVLSIQAGADGPAMQVPAFLTPFHGGYLSIGYGGTSIIELNAAGRFVREVGQKGAGPGDFGFINTLLPRRNGGVYVHDAGNGRLTALSSDLRVLKSWPLRLQAAGVPALIDDSTLAVSGLLTHPAHAGYTIHVVRLHPDGSTATRSFDRPAGAGPGSFEALLRTVTLAGSGGELWTAHQYRYHIELRDTAGGIHRVLTGDRLWMEYRPDQAYKPQLGSVQQDREGRLWLTFIVPTAEAAKVRLPMHEMPVRKVSLQDVVRTIIEVVNPATGELVARLQPDKLILLAPGQHAVSWDEDANGSTVTHLYDVRLSLNGPPGRRP